MQSAFRELRCTTGFVQTDFFPLDFTCITGQEACLAQRCAQFFVVSTQCAGDTVTDSAGLSGSAATADGNVEIKIFFHIDNFKWLTDNHTGGLTAKVFVQRLLVDDDIAAAATQEDAR